MQCLICLILIADIGVLLFQLKEWNRAQDTTPPMLSCSSAVPEYTPGGDVSILLKDVQAVDDKDGDVTSSVRIRSISFAEDGSKAVVTYVAKDQANNIGLLKRTLDVSVTEAVTEDVTEAAVEAVTEDVTEAANEAVTEDVTEAETETEDLQ